MVIWQTEAHFEPLKRLLSAQLLHLGKWIQDNGTLKKKQTIN